MNIRVLKNREALGLAAAGQAEQAIRRAIQAKNRANIILATGASQFDTLEKLTLSPSIKWSCVNMFHLDEYLGISSAHPASFRKYLKERFVDKVPALSSCNFVNGEAENPGEECARLGVLIKKHPIDVALIGIGENGHIAFNDPPADFDTGEPYIVVTLDEACRKQQVGEGWFPSLAEVPKKAISMSVRQILKSRQIILSVPDKRKAEAVKKTVEGPVTSRCPASILQEHPDCSFYLDEPAASLLKERS